VKRTAEQTALLLHRLLSLSGHKRARVSNATIRRLSNRRHLRAAFVNMLDEYLEDMGLILLELERGGYGVMYARTLEGAPPITAKKFLQDDLVRLRTEKDESLFDEIRQEIEAEQAIEDNEEP